MQQTTSNQNSKKQLFIGSSFVLIAALGFSAKAVLIKLAYGYTHRLDAITLMTLHQCSLINCTRGTNLATRELIKDCKDFPVIIAF